MQQTDLAGDQESVELENNCETSKFFCESVKIWLTSFTFSKSCDDRLTNNSLSHIYHRENLFAAFLVSEPPELEIRFSQIY